MEVMRIMEEQEETSGLFARFSNNRQEEQQQLDRTNTNLSLEPLKAITMSPVKMATTSSNQVEVIANEREDGKEMGNNDDCDHSFELQAEESNNNLKRNEWVLMQIVESAESKLQRQKRQQQQQQQQSFRLKPSTLLLKSPAFAKNTLDEDELQKLATNSGCSSNVVEREDLTDCGNKRDAIGTRESDGIQQVASCNRTTATTNMTNRCCFEVEKNEGRTRDCLSSTTTTMQVKEEKQNELSSSNQNEALAKVASTSSLAGGGASCKLLITNDTEEEEEEATSSKDTNEIDEREGATPTNDLVRELIHRDRLALLGQQSRSGKGKRFASREFGQKQQQQQQQQWRQQEVLASSRSELVVGPPIRAEVANVTSGGNGSHSNDTCLKIKRQTSSKGSSLSSLVSSSASIATTTTTTVTTNSPAVRSPLTIQGADKLDVSSSSSSSETCSVSSLPSSTIATTATTTTAARTDELTVRLAASRSCKLEQQPSREAIESSDLSTLISEWDQGLLIRNWPEAEQLDTEKLGSCNNNNSGKQEGFAYRTLFEKHSARKPSDPTSCCSQKRLVEQLDSERQQQRRHSTYMLPTLLLQLNPPESESESDEGEEEEDRHYISSLEDCPVDSKQLTKQLVTNERFPTSASSPSALSTPTNETGGCGAACCSRKAQLIQLEKENANLSRQLLSGPKTTTTVIDKQKQQTETLSNYLKPLHYVSSNEFHANSLDKQVLANSKPTARRRLGSNPLDRFRFTGQVGGDQNSLRRLVSSRRTGKRHSIINIFSSGGSSSGGSFTSGSQQQQQQPANSGNQLVKRLAHPRSLFSHHHNHNHHHNNNVNNLSSLEGTKLHRGSMDNQTLASQNSQYEPLIPESGFKIVVMGTSGSGKTSIIQRFMYNSFSRRHSPTVEDTYFIEFPYMKNMINISISDTSGTYEFPAMKRLAINSGDAFILVYSVDNPKSFDDLEHLRQTILEERERAYLEASASITSSSSSGIASGHSQSSVQSVSLNSPSFSNSSSSQLQHQHQQQLIQGTDLAANRQGDISPRRHWSLAALFNSVGGHQNNQNNHHQQQNLACSATTTTNGFNSHNSSICSSTCSSSDNSRRSSISAAEAALKTRRTRKPPMVIVANKYDLPSEKHLVNSDEIEALVVIDWNNGFVRSSAANNTNINEIFQQVLKQARQPPTLTEAIISKRRKSLPPKLPHSNNTSQQ